MKPHSAIKANLFADEHHRERIDSMGDPLAEIESHIDFSALAAEVDRVAPRRESAQGGRPPYPTETVVQILLLKRLYNVKPGWQRTAFEIGSTRGRASATIRCQSVSRDATDVSPGHGRGSSTCSAPLSRWVASYCAPSVRRGQTLL